MSRKVIMTAIDGCHRDTLYSLIDKGEAPFFTEMARNGVRVTDAVTMFPSTTMPCCSSIYTGCWYRNHGVLNNEWVDRFSTPVAARSYIAGMHYALESLDRKLFGWPTILLPNLNKGGKANNDLHAPTIYDELTAAGKTSYTFFHYIGRGATRWVRPSRTDMLVFGYVENWTKPLQIYERRMVTRVIQNIRRGGMPDLLSIYFGCNDGHSHRHGVAGQVEYIRDFIDPQMRRLQQAVARLCPNDEIYWAVTADHGQTTLSEQDRAHCLWADDFFPFMQNAGFEKAERGLSDNLTLDENDAIVSLGTGASVGFYLRSRATGDWKTQPRFDTELAPVLNNFLKANVNTAPYADWKFPGYCGFLLTRAAFDEPYRVYVNDPPFEGVGRLVPLEDFFADKSGYVRPIERLRGIDHPNGPDIVLVLNYFDHFNINEAENFHPGQHGSLLADDSYVPMIFSGPGIRHDPIPEAMTIDFSPTVASLLGVNMPKADGSPLPIFG